MSTKCPVEHVQCRFDLHECGDQVGFDGCLVRPQLARAQPGTLADSGVDDHTVNAANLIAEFGEYLGHPLVVVDVQLRDSDLDVGIPLRQFGFQFGQPIRAAGAERQVAALGGEGSGHPGAQAGTGAGDQDLLASHSGEHIDYLSSRDIRRSASALPPV